MRKLKLLSITLLVLTALFLGGLICPTGSGGGGILTGSGGGGLAMSAAAESPVTESVYLGGMPAGFILSSGEAKVVGVCDVPTAGGLCSPAKDAGIAVGDTILRLQEKRIRSAADIDRVLSGYKSGSVELVVKRNNREVTLSVTPAKELTGRKYKLGVLIRDTVSGIGTVTYIRQDGRFGSLGHAVPGEDGKPAEVLSGEMYHCSVVGVKKGIRGKAGELKGIFLNDGCIGKAEKNAPSGIYGTMNEKFCKDGIPLIRTGGIHDACPGNAEIYTTVDGVSPERYSIDIVKVDALNDENKNYVIRITDSTLLAKTGGIVQGMSGSPIVQNGKLVGAVTHVFLNDPTRGYGIALDNMDLG